MISSGRDCRLSWVSMALIELARSFCELISVPSRSKTIRRIDSAGMGFRTCSISSSLDGCQDTLHRAEQCDRDEENLNRAARHHSKHSPSADGETLRRSDV